MKDQETAKEPESSGAEQTTVCELELPLDLRVEGEEIAKTQGMTLPKMLVHLLQLTISGELIPKVINVAGLELRLWTHEVYRAGRAIKLSPTEFRLLLCLAQNIDQTVKRETLYETVWRGEPMTEEGSKLVDVYIRYLRIKLGEPNIIGTVLSVGYRLVSGSNLSKLSGQRFISSGS